MPRRIIPPLLPPGINGGLTVAGPVPGLIVTFLMLTRSQHPCCSPNQVRRLCACVAPLVPAYFGARALSPCPAARPAAPLLIRPFPFSPRDCALPVLPRPRSRLHISRLRHRHECVPGIAARGLPCRSTVDAQVCCLGSCQGDATTPSQRLPIIIVCVSQVGHAISVRAKVHMVHSLRSGN